LTISDNTLLDVGFLCPRNGCQYVGIDVGSNHSSTTRIFENTIYTTPNAVGVGVSVIQSQKASIRGNNIFGAYEAVYLTEDTGAVVQANTITDTFAAVTVNDNGSTGRNLVTNNTINEASCGIHTTLADVNDTIVHNTLLNVLITMTSGACN
jgi:nitrous oxidase accessory protein NosD